jgi:hypothetical protein
MARSRNIKPSFFLNEELAKCEYGARMLFVGLWTIGDRDGRLEDRPARIKAQVLPYDDEDIDNLLSQLAARGFIVRYEVDGCKYIQITNFRKHQNPHVHEPASTIPVPCEHGAKCADSLLPLTDSLLPNGEPPISPLASNRDGKPKTKRFKPPTVEEVAAYCAERNNGIDPHSFVDSNEAKGWLVGTTKTPMKNWKAAVRTWENHRKQSAPESRVPTDADNARWNPVDGGLGSEFNG